MMRFGINTKELEETISLIGRLFGIRVTFFDAEGEELRLESLRKMTSYCTSRRTDPDFAAQCVACDRKHLAAARLSRRTHVYRCHDGLIEGIIPLCDKGGIYLGSIVFGQIRDLSLRRKDLPRKSARLYAQLPAHSIAKAREVGTLLKYVSESIIHREIVRRRSLPWADKIEAYIDANLSRRIDVPALAKATGFSVSFIHHRFKEDFGMPPAQYVTGIKLKLARRMLLDGKTVKEAADALGFRDQFHFSRAFRKHFGHPPSSVRPLPWAGQGAPEV